MKIEKTLLGKLTEIRDLQEAELLLVGGGNADQATTASNGGCDSYIPNHQSTGSSIAMTCD